MRRNSKMIKKEKLSLSPVCYVCMNGSHFILELHHVFPLEMGGEDVPDNTELLCPNCHALVHYILTEKARNDFHGDITPGEIIESYSSSSIVKSRAGDILLRCREGMQRETKKLEANIKKIKEAH